jgi:cytochrome c
MPLISKMLSAQVVWCFGHACALVLAMVVSTLAQASAATPAGASTSASTSAPAAMTLEEGLALAKARACLGCHQVDNKRVGPSFRAIAQRHANKEDVTPYLVQVIRKGGRGQWGAVPMPGQSVSEQDAEKLAQWIISLRN